MKRKKHSTQRYTMFRVYGICFLISFAIFLMQTVRFKSANYISGTFQIYWIILSGTALFIQGFCCIYLLVKGPSIEKLDPSMNLQQIYALLGLRAREAPNSTFVRNVMVIGISLPLFLLLEPGISLDLQQALLDSESKKLIPGTVPDLWSLQLPILRIITGLAILSFFSFCLLSFLSDRYKVKDMPPSVSALCITAISYVVILSAASCVLAIIYRLQSGYLAALIALDAIFLIIPFLAMFLAYRQKKIMMSELDDAKQDEKND